MALEVAAVGPGRGVGDTWHAQDLHRLNVASVQIQETGRERTVRILDDIRAAVGDDPAHWLPRLLEQA